MTVGQTTISKVPAVALEGMLADGGMRIDKISSVLTDAAGIGPGRCVKGGTSYGVSCAALTTAGDTDFAQGFVLRESFKEPSTPMFALGSDLALVRSGRIWLICVDDMSAVLSGSKVHVVTSGADAGRPQLSAVGADFPSFLTLLKGGAAGALGLFEINM